MECETRSSASGLVIVALIAKGRNLITKETDIRMEKIKTKTEDEQTPGLDLGLTEDERQPTTKRILRR